MTDLCYKKNQIFNSLSPKVAAKFPGQSAAVLVANGGGVGGGREGGRVAPPGNGSPPPPGKGPWMRPSRCQGEHTCRPPRYHGAALRGGRGRGGPGLRPPRPPSSSSSHAPLSPEGTPPPRGGGLRDTAPRPPFHPPPPPPHSPRSPGPRQARLRPRPRRPHCAGHYGSDVALPLPPRWWPFPA